MSAQRVVNAHKLAGYAVEQLGIFDNTGARYENGFIHIAMSLYICKDTKKDGKRQFVSFKKAVL